MNSFRQLLDSPVFDLLAQSGKVSGTQAAAAAGVGIVAFGFILTIAIAVYVFFCFCMKRICEKAGHEPGILIWIPIANLIPQLKAAQLPVWMIVLCLIPFVNVFAVVYLWVKLCIARGKPGPLGLLILIPGVNLGLICWLAFAD
ncbi:MAG: hypothetical protein RL514_4446 [Verrucomicrobiota bacterium]|jgi:hypothetical protein